MERLLGTEWYNQLHFIVSNGLLSSTAQKVNNERLNNNIIPPKGSLLMFRAFRETPFSKVKVIILGNEPSYMYENGIPTYDGLAFSGAASYFPSQTLDIILDEVELECYEGFSLNRKTKYDLLSWAEQGVLLLNTTHTVSENKDNSHLNIWKPFTEHVIKLLNKKHGIVWMLWGEKAIKYQNLITNTTHAKICTSYPSFKSKNTSLNNYPAFKNSNCFLKVNEELDARNISKIMW